MRVPIQREPFNGELAVVRDCAEQLVGENLDGTDESVGRARENDVWCQCDERIDGLRVAIKGQRSESVLGLRQKTKHTLEHDRHSRPSRFCD